MATVTTFKRFVNEITRGPCTPRQARAGKLLLRLLVEENIDLDDTLYGPFRARGWRREQVDNAIEDLIAGGAADCAGWVHGDCLINDLTPVLFPTDATLKWWQRIRRARAERTAEIRKKARRVDLLAEERANN
jgi:hypothetical protein